MEAINQKIVYSRCWCFKRASTDPSRNTDQGV